MDRYQKRLCQVSAFHPRRRRTCQLSPRKLQKNTKRLLLAMENAFNCVFFPLSQTQQPDSIATDPASDYYAPPPSDARNLRKTSFPIHINEAPLNGRPWTESRSVKSNNGRRSSQVRAGPREFERVTVTPPPPPPPPEWKSHQHSIASL